ncbi:hypothetical protein BG004_003534 [Podila humilis]|nr:hypothetical protein BG004_003534 [Podila humilis]
MVAVGSKAVTLDHAGYSSDRSASNNNNDSNMGSAEDATDVVGTAEDATDVVGTAVAAFVSSSPSTTSLAAQACISDARVTVSLSLTGLDDLTGTSRTPQTPTDMPAQRHKTRPENPTHSNDVHITNTSTSTDAGDTNINTATINLNITAPSSPPPTATSTVTCGNNSREHQQPWSAASTPSNGSLHEGYTNHPSPDNKNNKCNTHTNNADKPDTTLNPSGQLPPSPVARPHSVRPHSPTQAPAPTTYLPSTPSRSLSASPPDHSSALNLHHGLAERRQQPTESIVSSASHSSSRARVRPLSVCIDLSMQDPPAYEPAPPHQGPLQQLQTEQQSHSPSHYRNSVAASSMAGSMALSQQQEQLLATSPYSARTSITTGSIFPRNSSPIPSLVATDAAAAFIALASVSAPRRPFLEEDELPEYITLSDNGPPFKIPASDSITYTVIPSQGPEEFRQLPSQDDEIVIHQPTSRRRASTATGQARQADPATLNRASISMDPGESSSHQTSQGRDQEELGETILHTRRQGAWTLEYWVNDTIMYLCYLMDPKHSDTTTLIPQRLFSAIAHQTSAESDQINVETREQQEPNDLTASIPNSLSHNESRDTSVDTSGDMFNTFLGSRSEPSNIDGHEGNRVSTTSETTLEHAMERVPTGHLRGRPPPLTRTRAQQYRPMSPSTDHRRAIDALYGVGRGMSALATIVARSSHQSLHFVDNVGDANAATNSSVPATASRPPTTVNSPVGEAAQVAPTAGQTGNLQSVQTETTIASANTAPERQEAGETPAPTGEPLDERNTPPAQIVDSHGPHGHFTTLPLPPIRPFPEPHQTPLETRDSADAANAREVQEHTQFNNALAADFFRNPTYALVSAEDPQTWIWWSTHHELNLQRCRQEGPNEEVMMWWRTRTDYNTKENKEKRRRLKQWQKWQARELVIAQQNQREQRRLARQQLQQQRREIFNTSDAEGHSHLHRHRSRDQRQNQHQNQNGRSQTLHDTHHSPATERHPTSSWKKKDGKKKKKVEDKGTFLERISRFIESRYPSTPHYENMEITMRVRGLYYSWREEDCGNMLPLNTDASASAGHFPAESSHSRRHRNSYDQYRQGATHQIQRSEHHYHQEDLQEYHSFDGTNSHRSAPDQVSFSTVNSPSVPMSITPDETSPRSTSVPPPGVPLLGQLRSRPRMFTLVRDESLVMGQRVKGGPVAEIWISEDDPSLALHEYFAASPIYPSTYSRPPPPPPSTYQQNSLHYQYRHERDGIEGGLAIPSSSVSALSGVSPSVGIPISTQAATSAHADDATGPAAVSTTSGTTPYFIPLSATSDGASSITSNNGNTFMTEVSVATGGAMRSTVASTFMAPVPSGRSFASSFARYNVSAMGSPVPPSLASSSSSRNGDGGGRSDNDDDDNDDDDERDVGCCDESNEGEANHRSDEDGRPGHSGQTYLYSLERGREGASRGVHEGVIASTATRGGNAAAASVVAAADNSWSSSSSPSSSSNIYYKPN